MHELPPIHPGQLLRDEVLPSLRLSVSQAASEMGVARQTLYRILAGQSAVTADMALRLAQLSGTEAEAWLTLQQAYDLCRARKGLTAVLAAIPAYRLPHSCRIARDASHVG